MKFSLCLTYYENPTMLGIQLENWRKMKDYCNLIVVDDGSPKNPAREIAEKEDGFSLYEVAVDFPWHQHGCRNLAALVAESPFLYMTDIDHLLKPEDAEKLATERHEFDDMLMFQRVTAPNMVYHKPHPNTFFVSRDKYWEVGGYDEDFCDIESGVPCYGGDGIFTRQLTEVTNSMMRHDIKIIRYPREYVADASTTQFDRKGEYKENYRKLFDKKRAENDLVPKDPIRFKWERVF